MNLQKFPIRLIVSIIAGILTATSLSIITHELLYLGGIFPPLHKPMLDTHLVLIELAYHSLFAVIGAMITSKIAREKAKKAVMILGTKEAIMWILGTILLWHHTPPWYNITKAVLGVPLALLGGKIYTRFQRKQAGAAV
jgi:hypothetical protein